MMSFTIINGYAVLSLILAANVSLDVLIITSGLPSLSFLSLGMISHKMSLITNFGHKHFRQKFNIFHEKISTAPDFGSYLVSNFKF